MRRLRTGTSMRRAASKRVRSSSAMGPRSGRTSPAITLIRRRLAGARRAKEGGDAAGACERADQHEARPASSRCRRRAWSLAMRRWRRAGRASVSESEQRGEGRRRRRSSVRRSAGSSPPGTCVIGVDRRRHRLGDARNVADEGDGGAEFAERARKGEHHAGEDTGERQRQGDGRRESDPPWRRASPRPPPGADRWPRSTGGWRAPSAESP